jgi:hypothetical protein
MNARIMVEVSQIIPKPELGDQQPCEKPPCEALSP